MERLKNMMLWDLRLSNSKNRAAVCSAFILPGDAEPLLGVIPMKEMDVLIHPRRQELIVNPESPDIAMLKMK